MPAERVSCFLSGAVRRAINDRRRLSVERARALR